VSEPGRPADDRAPLVLASTSPRRRAILSQLRIPFELATPSYEERSVPGASPWAVIEEHALGKARSVSRLQPARTVLGVDTGVVLGSVLYGKPADAGDARRILGELAGREHVVVSAVCLVSEGVERLRVAETAVTFRPLTRAQVASYVDAAEWEGLAGGYAIQGLGAVLVERVEGDYLNVVGLPATLLLDLLAEARPDLLPIGG
jgi:septum formation protein